MFGSDPDYARGGWPAEQSGWAAEPARWAAEAPTWSPDHHTHPVSAPSVGDPGPAYGFDMPSPGRRIEPTPEPKGRLLPGVLIGLLAGLLVFGAAGFFTGRATLPSAAPVTTGPSTTVAPVPSASLSRYAQNQVAINRPKFDGGLAAVSERWLPQLSGCARGKQPGGPSLLRGERTRVRCQFDGMSVTFVEYVSAADRDKARVKTLGQNVDARQLAPGVAEAGVKAAPSGHTSGNYVEYAYTVAEGRTQRVVTGIWWDDAATPVAAYLLAYWKDGLGESWEPMRDVWATYA